VADPRRPAEGTDQIPGPSAVLQRADAGSGWRGGTAQSGQPVAVQASTCYRHVP